MLHAVDQRMRAVLQVAMVLGRYPKNYKQAGMFWFASLTLLLTSSSAQRLLVPIVRHNTTSGPRTEAMWRLDPAGCNGQGLILSQSR